MARIPGRNLLIAVPAGIVCTAVVAALVYLAQPLVPATIAWMGDMLRAASTPPTAAPADPHPDPRTTVGECRDLYPDDVWVELTWTPHAVLSQSADAPATAVTTLTDALAPKVRLTCTWRLESGGTISSTLADVAPDAEGLAADALRGQGFSCSDGAELTCTRTQGDVVEEHALHDGLWLSSVETSWHPDDFGSRLASHLWH